jgi:hypothetical protein
METAALELNPLILMDGKCIIKFFLDLLLPNIVIGEIDSTKFFETAASE